MINDILYLTRAQVQKYEPAVSAVSAIYSPSTGIIDSYKLMSHFEAKAKAKANGVNFAYKTKVTSIEKLKKGRYEVQVVYPDNKQFSFITNKLINCAGLEADRVQV